MKVLPFKHRYTKLAKDRFTTVRGPSFGLALKPGELVLCQTPDGQFQARVESVEFPKVRDIPVAVLAADVAGHKEVRSVAEFVSVVNSLRRIPPMPRLELGDEVALIRLAKDEGLL